MIPPIHLFLRRTQFSCTSARASHTCLLHVRTLFPRIYTHTRIRTRLVRAKPNPHTLANTHTREALGLACSLARTLSLSLSLSLSRRPDLEHCARRRTRSISRALLRFHSFRSSDHSPLIFAARRRPENLTQSAWNSL